MTRRQAGDNGSHAHVDVGSPLVLRHQGPAQGNQALERPTPKDDDGMGVDAQAGDHLGVVAGGQHGQPQFCVQKPDDPATVTRSAIRPINATGRRCTRQFPAA